MNDPIFQPCAAWAEKLAATHADDLSPIERAELEEHVAHCTACAAVRAEYRLMDERIHNYGTSETLLTSPVPSQLVDSGIGPPLSTLDRLHRRGLRNRVSLHAPFLSPHHFVRKVSVVILIFIVCLLASLLLSMYFLKTVVWGF